MCTLTNLGNMGGELPNLECDNCDTIFSVVWHRTPDYDDIQYCPFCGEGVEEIVWETEEE